MRDFLKQISINKLARYGYPGFLVLLIIYAYDIAPLSKMITKENWELIMFFTFCFGTTFYIFYRYIIGELILYRLTNWVHKKLDKSKCKCTDKYNNTSMLLFLSKEMNVKEANSRTAYNYLRRGLFSDKEIENFDFYHTEIYFLYMTTVIGVGYYFLIFLIKDEVIHPTLTLWIIGILVITFWIAAMVVDIKQQTLERRFLEFGKSKKGIPMKDELKVFLQGYGLI